VILAGAVPAALIALIVDAALLGAERQLSARRRTGSLRRVLGVGAVIAALVLWSSGVAARRSSGAIVVGSKNFTEQVILGELLAQTIEREAGLPVDRRLNLGGTLICDRALLTGDVDVYVEYTGTALTAIFHQPVPSVSRVGGAGGAPSSMSVGGRESGESPSEGRVEQVVYDTVRELYGRSRRTLLPPLGFNNTFAILVRGRDARDRGLRTIDDLAREAPQWQAGFGYEFLERPDGFRDLAKTYGLRFAGPPRVMDLTLTYRALASGQVDVIAGDATAGLIKGLDLVQLEDNRHYFPPYDAAPVARAEVLLRYPRVRAALEQLGGRVSADDMRAMNYAADVEHKDVSAIVAEFLARAQTSMVR
jgi:osmoprotectant transport system permease protein